MPLPKKEILEAALGNLSDWYIGQPAIIEATGVKQFKVISHLLHSGELPARKVSANGTIGWCWAVKRSDVVTYKEKLNGHKQTAEEAKFETLLAAIGRLEFALVENSIELRKLQKIWSSET